MHLPGIHFPWHLQTFGNDSMIIYDMVDPWKQENLANAFCNLAEEVPKNSKVDFRTNVKDWLKNKYNYDIEYILDERGVLNNIQINTDEAWFILKHG